MLVDREPPARKERMLHYLISTQLALGACLRKIFVSEIFTMNPERIRKYFNASLVSNTLRVNTEALKSNHVLSFTVSWRTSNFLSQENTYFTHECKKSELCIPYSPVLPDTGDIAVSLIDQNNKTSKFNLPCKPWFIEIENSEPGKLIGWIAAEAPSYVLRPFILYIDNNKVSYKIKIHGEREDVSASFKDQNLKGYDFNIVHGFSTLNKDIADVKLCYEEHKQAFYEKQISIKRWNSLTKYNDLHCSKSSAALASDSSQKIIKIVVLMPIYDGVNETLEAIDSFKNYFNNVKPGNLEVRFVLGLDNPQNHEMKEKILSLYGNHDKFMIICNQTNLGFIGNCNNMFEYVQDDEEILLVNSDIIAPQNQWIEIMLEYAKSDESVGTVTPFSNQATIFSYPIPNEQVQLLPPGIDIDDLNTLFSRELATELIDVPSCHGFCVLLMKTRLSIDTLFNPIFGKGYGEENELSRRIAKLGYRNICCPKVYVYHCESVSFGKARQDLISKNLVILNQLHEKYDLMVYLYCKDDPLRKYKNTCTFRYLGLIKSKKNAKLLLHVCHNRGGGTHKFIIDYARNSSNYIHCLLVPLNESGLMRLELIQSSESKNTTINTIKLGILSESDVFDLSCMGLIDKTILHSLIDFLDNGNFDWIKALLSQSTSELYFHDYHWISVFENLLNPRFQYTGNFHPCDTLVDLHLIEQQKKPIVVSKSATSHRKVMKVVIDTASELIFPSKTCRDIVLKSFDVKNSFRVVPHDDSTANAGKISIKSPKQVAKNSRIDIAVIGAIGPNKGAYALFELCRYIYKHDLAINIYVIGFTCNNNAIKDYSFVHIVGSYDENDFSKIVANYNLQYSLFLSPWPETFSYTISLAFDNKLWPFVLNTGAPAERVADSGFGTLLDSDDPSEICQKIIEVAHA